MSSELQKNLKSLFKSTSLIFIVRIFGMGIAFFFQRIISRTVGINGYGEYTIYMNTINVIVILAVFGIDSSLIRSLPRISRSDKLQRKMLEAAIATVFVISVLIAIILFLFKSQFVSFFEISSPEYYYAIPIVILFLSISKVIDGFLQGTGKTTQSIVFNSFILNVSKMVMFFIFFLTTKMTLFSAIVSYLTTEIIMLTIRVIYIVISGRKNKLNADSKYGRKSYEDFLRYSFTLFVISGVDILIHTVDKYMIAGYVNVAGVGLYKCAENYLPLIGIFVSPFVAFWPMMSNLYKDKKIEMLNQIFGYIVKIIGILSIPMVIFMVTFSKELLGFFGSGAVAGNNIFYILLIGTMFDALSGPAGALLNMTKYAKYNLINMFMLLVINVILNYIFIHMWGPEGAALATSLSMILINIVNIIQNKILLKVFPYDWGNIYLILSGVVVYFIDKWLYSMIDIYTIPKMLMYMILFIGMNYILFIGMFTITARPDYKKIYSQLRRKNS